MSFKSVVFALIVFGSTLSGQQDLYTPSDPARIATTGRPQLVEFFHPL